MAALLFGRATSARGGAPQNRREQLPAVQPLGVQIVSSGNEPELRVDGVPFFIHATQFDYFRIPPNLWPQSLERYRELGINTIDLRIPWNWHEPIREEFDFDGHTNPRRDLRRLLKLVVQMHLKVIARPGPLIGDNWRNAGYPAWLLADGSSPMSPAAINDGDPPPIAEIAARDGNAAANEWLANATFMNYARRWMTAVARELAPFSASRLIAIPEPGAQDAGAQEEQVSGPLLFTLLDDSTSVLPGSDISDLSRYFAELRVALAKGGLTCLSFLSSPHAGVQGIASFPAASPGGAPPISGIAGEWSIEPPGSGEDRKVFPVRSPLPSGSAFLTTTDASALAFLANSLTAQPDFPPFLARFSATTLTPPSDLRAIQPPLEDTLLASRILIGNGLRGITYSPLQDSLTPAGWETQSAPRYQRWDAALDLAGNPKPLAGTVSRNGRLFAAWGAMLASSHLRADFGIVDLRNSRAGNSIAENARIAQGLDQLIRVARLAGFSPELVNPAEQSVERLLRDQVIVLAMPGDETGALELSERAQAALVEFVRRGGGLVYLPSQPTGALLEPLWKAAPAIPPSGPNFNEWTFEKGRVIAASNDFSSWVSLKEALSQNLSHPEAADAIESLAALLSRSGAPQTVRRIESGQLDPNLFATQLIANNPASSPVQQQPNAQGQLYAAALISATNFSPDQAANESLEILDPRPPAGDPASKKILLNVTLPPHESLLLPVHAGLCTAMPQGDDCSDEVLSSGSELLRAMRDGKTLELTFFVPVRATVRLRLQSAPLKVELDGDIKPDSEWNQDLGEFEVTLLRGAAPGFRRVLRIQLPYTPHVAEKLNHAGNNHFALEGQVLDGVRMPLGDGVTIPSAPPLILAEPSTGGYMTVEARNHSEVKRSIEYELEGAFRGTGNAKINAGGQQFTRLRFQPSRDPKSGDATAAPAADSLLRGNLTIRSGRESLTGPVMFLTADEAGNSHYQYDFDLDGAPEWVLESGQLRLIVSPADGGRALALVDKATNDDLITFGGAFHDFLIPGDSVQDPPGSGDFSLNRAYQAEWVGKKKDVGLRLTFREPPESRGSLQVEKTLRLAAPEILEAVYRISPTAPAVGAIDGTPVQQTFVSMVSIPLPDADVGNSRICWKDASPSPATTGDSTLVAKAAPEPHCEEIIPAGPPIAVPNRIAHMEVLTPGRRPLGMEWTAGRVTVVPKLFSAQVKFMVPAPQPGLTSVEYSLRYTVPGSGK